MGDDEVLVDFEDLRRKSLPDIYCHVVKLEDENGQVSAQARFSDEEMERINLRARLAGLSVGEYLKARCLGKIPSATKQEQGEPKP
jgi:hypothetical protein